MEYMGGALEAASEEHLLSLKPVLTEIGAVRATPNGPIVRTGELDTAATLTFVSV